MCLFPLTSLTTLLLFKKSELFSVHRRNPPDSWCIPVSVEDNRLFVLSFRNIEKSVCVCGGGVLILQLYIVKNFKGRSMLRNVV